MGDAELVALAIARVLLGLPDDRFTGLPSSLVIGKRERFAVDDRIEAFVSGTAHVQMIDEQGQVFADVQLVTVIDEAWVMLELGNRAAQIVATAVEEHLDGTSCTRTISQTVTAQNRIYFPSRCYDPRYKARLGRRCLRRRQFHLRKLRWRQWDSAVARAQGVALANDCVPYCAKGRFHRLPVSVKVYARKRCGNIDRYV